MRKRVIREILDKKCIAIIRAVEPEKLLPLATALADGGITLIEVTFDHSRPKSYQQTADAISAIATHLGNRVIVGAGTVLTPTLVEMAEKAGAKYIIAPDTNPVVITRTKELGLVSIPGAFTPTEVKLAHSCGADFVKVFPCVVGPQWVKALAAPLKHIPLLAVGGVSAANAAAFLQAGAKGVGVGGNLVNKAWIEAGEFDKITAEARALVAAVREAG